MTTMQAVNLGGVSTGEYVLVETDNPIKVAVNSTNTNAKIAVSGAFMVSGGSVTGLWLQNESTTNTATVQAVVVD